MTVINIKLYNEKLITGNIVSLTLSNENLIESLLTKAVDSKNIKSKKTLRRNASIREIEAAIAVLLESPNGITRGELLGSTDSENLSSVVIRIRNYLKSNNLYTLIKYIKNKKIRYRLDKT